MKKVYQTIVDKGHGNCMQATMASLFDLELKDVPNCVECGEKWFEDFDKFLDDRGYDFWYFNRRDEYSTEFLKELAHFDGGINGYLYGVVNSQTYEDTTHAIVIDLDLNIIHDPNPNQRALKLTPDDIIGFYLTKKIVIAEGNKIMLYDDYIKLDNN